MKKNIEFVGVAARDGECFCWEVTKKEVKASGILDALDSNYEGMYRIYPDDLMDDDDTLYTKKHHWKITIEALPIEEENAND